MSFESVCFWTFWRRSWKERTHQYSWPFQSFYFWSFGLWELMTHRGAGPARAGVQPGAYEGSAPLPRHINS